MLRLICRICANLWGEPDNFVVFVNHDLPLLAYTLVSHSPTLKAARAITRKELQSPKCGFQFIHNNLSDFSVRWLQHPIDAAVLGRIAAPVLIRENKVETARVIVHAQTMQRDTVRNICWVAAIDRCWKRVHNDGRLGSHSAYDCIGCGNSGLGFRFTFTL